MRTVYLEIAGSKYKMTSDADEGHLLKLASVINERVVALGPNAQKASSPAHLLAVVALGLADDLLGSEDRRGKVEKLTKDTAKKIIEKIDHQLSLNAQ